MHGYGNWIVLLTGLQIKQPAKSSPASDVFSFIIICLLMYPSNYKKLLFTKNKRTLFNKTQCETIINFTSFEHYHLITTAVNAGLLINNGHKRSNPLKSDSWRQRQVTEEQTSTDIRQKLKIFNLSEKEKYYQAKYFDNIQ
jgi:hypothetical protein